MTRNLQAQEDFEKGDVDCATGHKVSRATKSGTPTGSFVTALRMSRLERTGGLKIKYQSSPRPRFLSWGLRANAARRRQKRTAAGYLRFADDVSREARASDDGRCAPSL